MNDAEAQQDRDSVEPRRPSYSGRRHARIRVEVSVSVQSEHNFYGGFLENASISGLFVATHTPARLGDRVEFAIDFGDTEGPVVGVGKVRWLRQYSDTSDAPPGMGLEFIELSADSRKRIDEFLWARTPLFFDDDLES